ncbi:unnamed protein product [Boreogadus saida]
MHRGGILLAEIEEVEHVLLGWPQTREKEASLVTGADEQLRRGELGDSGGGDMEEKGIVLPEMSCRTATFGLPQKLRQQSGSRVNSGS